MPARSFESTSSPGAWPRVSDYVVETEVDVELVNGELRITTPVRGDAAGSEIIAGPLAEWMPAEERWCTYRDEVITDPSPTWTRATVPARQRATRERRATTDRARRMHA